MSPRNASLFCSGILSDLELAAIFAAGIILIRDSYKCEHVAIVLSVKSLSNALDWMIDNSGFGCCLIYLFASAIKPA
jgi:hypothetical protein